MSYYVIDAFTATKFGGNPAGVVIHENLDEEFMQKFAAEVRFSETAFIKKIDNKNFDIKFFTPTEQVELCGHATIASFKALLDSCAIEDNNTYFMKTLAGTLAVEVNQSFIMMEQAEPQLGKIFDDYDNLSYLFKIDKSKIGDINVNLVPQAVSTGLWDIMLPIKTKDDLYALNPNFKALAEYTKINKVGGVHAFTLDTEDGIAESRNFCPLYGIDEEAATGTSNGALTYYLFHNHILNEFDQEYLFLQGHSMGRPSNILTKLINKNNPRVMVGGQAIILSKGELC
ncbi:PhzF family phenazine biosynthesis protein [Lysinibacillus xylanilyticus]|uniref:PhzF family phenazine biosynthesis protein n=1 Tax=Lysinibacillus xylanilyticus TaxID=582475 RepID=UPI002B247B27|nr:PhzF family phenazine biosynthesis protein [Lysinibacillus xylanilyticus]MEB2279132.1 PhzF family phenazine biosynthesis protein [Lysinibacillus xylanilyticus]